jgi:hypothetical protein
MKLGEIVRVDPVIAQASELGDLVRRQGLLPHHLSLRQPDGTGTVTAADSSVVFVQHSMTDLRCAAYLPDEVTSISVRPEPNVISKAERAADPGGGIRPDYYGGPDDPFEPLKIIEAWSLDFSEGNVLKYLRRWKRKGGVADLRKLVFYAGRVLAQAEAKGVNGVPGT